MNTIELMNGTLLECFKNEQDRHEQERGDKEEKVFLDNAFFFLAHRDKIMKDSRMFLTPVPIRHTIFFWRGNICLGDYLEWWLSCESARRMSDDNRMLLVYLLAGSHCSGSNRCHEVDEFGTTEGIQLSNFSSAAGQFIRIAERYKNFVGVYEAYSLEEVVEILKREEAEGRTFPQDYAALFTKTRQ